MQNYDLIIIGGGCAGLSAAMYAGRLEMKTLVIADNMGGTITLTDLVENYPGFIRLTGQELADKLKEHALDYKQNVEMKEERVERIEKKSKEFSVKTSEGNYSARTLLFATGTIWKELKVPGHDEFKSKGIQYCALCDGALFKNKIVAVVGGSDSAAKEALVLARYASKVYIIYRGEQIHPEPPNMVRVEKEIEKGKIEIISHTNVKEIKGDKFVTSVMLDKEYNGSKELPLQGVFVSIGHIPLSDLAKDIGVKLNNKNEIIINRNSETNVAGVFAAGDVCDTQFKQAIVGVGEAVSAVYSAYKYIEDNEIVPV